jgi:hypothetical protein
MNLTDHKNLLISCAVLAEERERRMKIRNEEEKGDKD